MADEPTTTEETTEKQKGGKLKLILMIGVPLLLAGGGAVFFLGGGEAAAEEATTTTIPVEGEVIEVDTLTVNLVGEEGRYAKLGFAVVLAEGADNGIVGRKLPLLRDAALSVMTGFGSAELQTREGMERLRQALTDEMVALFPGGEVLRAVLTEMIVQ